MLTVWLGAVVLGMMEVVGEEAIGCSIAGVGEEAGVGGAGMTHASPFQVPVPVRYGRFEVAEEDGEVSWRHGRVGGEVAELGGADACGQFSNC